MSHDMMHVSDVSDAQIPDICPTGPDVYKWLT